MASAIDPTKPVDGVAADKADLRANLLAAKTEIEALQNAPGSDAAPSQIASTSTTFPLPLSGKMHTNAELQSHAVNVDYEVPAAATPASKWLISAAHRLHRLGRGNVGTVNGVAGGAARLILNGVAVVEVRSNPGSAPAVQVRGSVIVAPVTVSGTKTYTNDDSNNVYNLTSTSTQTFSATANYAAGYNLVPARRYRHDHDRWCDEQLHDHGAGGREHHQACREGAAAGKTRHRGAVSLMNQLLGSRRPGVEW